MKTVFGVRTLLTTLLVCAMVSLVSCNKDDKDTYVFVPLTQAEKTLQINQMQGEYSGYLYYNYNYVYYRYADSLKVNWSVRANDSTLTISNFPMKVFAKSQMDTDMKDALINDSLHSITSRIVLYRPWGTTGTLQSAYYNFIPKSSEDFKVDIPIQINKVEKKVSFLFSSSNMNSVYSIGGFSNNEMMFNMILNQLKVDGGRTYDANTLVVFYGKKS